MGLPWIRLDTNLPMHDKIINLASYGDRGLAAAFVYVSSLAYAGANNTDGFIPKGALPFLHGKPSHAKLLLEVRLWEDAERGWKIRNYGDRNVVGAVQQAISESLSEAGKKGAAARWGTPSPNGHGPAKDEANGQPHGEANGQANGHLTMARSMRSDGTYVTDVTNERPPRLRSVISSPSRARGKAKAQRELEDLARRKRGGAA